MKTTNPLVTRVCAANPARANEMPAAGESEFLTRGLDAGIKARETGVTISAVESIARLKALSAKRAAIASQDQHP